MASSSKLLLPERNPETHAKHRREVFWQIIFPMLIGLLLVLTIVAIIIFSGTTTTSDLARWADVSMIWLILPSLVMALLFLIILIAFIYLFTVILRITPHYARIVQLYFETGKSKVYLIADKITDPIVKSRSIWAVVRHPGQFGKRPPDYQ